MTSRVALLLALAACTSGTTPGRDGTAPSDPTGQPTGSTGGHTDTTTTPTTATSPGGTTTAPEEEEEDRDPSFLFEDVVVSEFTIELDPEALEALAAEPREYVVGRFVYGDEVYDPVGVRLKGNGSFQPIDQKPSFKISFDEYDPDQEFHGLEKLVLNNLANDPSSMHERVAHRLYREAGVPDVRSGHAFVHLNDEVYGLYAVDENVDEDLLKGWYDDADGSMWEIFDSDFTVVGVPLFEHEEGDDDRSTLTAMGEVLDTVEPGDWDAVAPYLDQDQFLRYWAVSAIVGQYDAYPYSFPGDDVHLYRDPADGLVDFLPHGCDETFRDGRLPIDFVNGHLAGACLSDLACFQRFGEEVWDVLALAEEIDLAGYGEEVQDALEPWIAQDVRAAHTPEDRAAQTEGFFTFLEERQRVVEFTLGPRPE